MQDDMTLTGVKVNNVISKDSVFLARTEQLEYTV